MFIVFVASSRSIVVKFKCTIWWQRLGEDGAPIDIEVYSTKFPTLGLTLCTKKSTKYTFASTYICTFFDTNLKHKNTLKFFPILSLLLPLVCTWGSHSSPNFICPFSFAGEKKKKKKHLRWEKINYENETCNNKSKRNFILFFLKQQARCNCFNGFFCFFWHFILRETMYANFVHT